MTRVPNSRSWNARRAGSVSMGTRPHAGQQHAQRAQGGAGQRAQEAGALSGRVDHVQAEHDLAQRLSGAAREEAGVEQAQRGQVAGEPRPGRQQAGQRAPAPPAPSARPRFRRGCRAARTSSSGRLRAREDAARAAPPAPAPGRRRAAGPSDQWMAASSSGSRSAGGSAPASSTSASARRARPRRGHGGAGPLLRRAAPVASSSSPSSRRPDSIGTASTGSSSLLRGRHVGRGRRRRGRLLLRALVLGTAAARLAALLLPVASRARAPRPSRCARACACPGSRASALRRARRRAVRRQRALLRHGQQGAAERTTILRAGRQPAAAGGTVHRASAPRRAASARCRSCCANG